MATETVILIGIGIYVLMMLAVGVYASRKTHSAAEFAVAGRRLPLWLCTATIVATWFGGGSMMGVSGAAYSQGLLGVIADPFGAAVCLFLIAIFFARFLRRLKYFTFVEFVEARFGPSCALIAAFGAMFSTTVWTAGMLVAFGLILESLTGIPLVVGIVGGSFVVVVYTAIGGMLAVALTDSVQITIVLVGLIVLFVAALADAGGWSQVAAQVPEHTWRMYPLQHTAGDWLNYVRAWLIFGLADVASQSLQQRALAAKNERVAQNSFYLAGFAYLLLGMIPVLLGIVGGISMPGLDNAEALLPTLALEHLHPVAVAVFVGALLAAIMSSADSTLLASATIVSTNLLPRVIENPSDRLQLTVARVSIAVFGAGAVATALNAQVVFDNILDSNLLMLAAIIVPFVLGVWWKRANRSGALAAMIVGIVVWLVSPFLFDGLPADLLGLGASLAAMLIVTPLTQKSDPPRQVVDHDGNPVELKNRLGILIGPGRPSHDH